MSHLYSAESIDLEKDLDEATVNKLCAVGNVRVFQHNELLYRQGDPAAKVFVLLTGSVKATSSNAHGFETMLRIHGPGSLLGLSSLRPTGLRDANGIAIGVVETICLSSKLFLKILQDDGVLALQLIRVLLKRQQELHSRIRAVLGNSVEQRLAGILLQLSSEAIAAPKANPSPEISITHEDLAALVLSRRQYVTQILRDFVSRELITTARKRVRIIDPGGLRRIADE